MKKCFYISALLTTMLLNLAHADRAEGPTSNWKDVPLTDTNQFNINCQYRFALEPSEMYYTTFMNESVIRTSASGPISVKEIRYLDKTTAIEWNSGKPRPVTLLQSRCD
ncbi:MAG: hypothetical protein K0R14_468 [Burkholderiales bacterium]|jgi:hypothetical protein|nr:hypothetical protein [Burkholderiales bacterium]